MKLIALKAFANVPELKGHIDAADLEHDKHVHKGHEFNIGTGKTLKDLTAAERQLVATLVLAGCVGDGTDTKIVKAVEEEIALDKKREANAAKLDAAAKGNALIEQLTELFKKAAATPAPAGK